MSNTKLVILLLFLVSLLGCSIEGTIVSSEIVSSIEQVDFPKFASHLSEELKIKVTGRGEFKIENFPDIPFGKKLTYKDSYAVSGDYMKYIYDVKDSEPFWFELKRDASGKLKVLQAAWDAYQRF